MKRTGTVTVLTCLLLAVWAALFGAIAAATGFDDTVVVRPRMENYWTGRARVDGGKWSGNLGIIPNPDFRAWAMFDLAAVPDSALITGAVLHYITFPGYDTAYGLWRHLSNDPLTAPGPALYAECGSAPVVSDTAYEPVSGEAQRTLNGTGLAAIQESLGADRVAFGWQRYNSNGRRYARGIETPGQEPFLVVAFKPPVAVRETRTPSGAFRSRASIVRGVLRMGDSRQGTGYGAELLDAAGRKVMELYPGANDVYGLAPGVYFVRPKTGNRLERVVIAR